MRKTLITNDSFIKNLFLSTLILLLLFSISTVNAADNQMDDVLCSSNLETDAMSLDNDLEKIDSISDVDSQAVKADSISKNNLRSSTDDIVQVDDSRPGNFSTLEKEISDCKKMSLN